MPNLFFPRDKQFWLYHCGVLGIVSIITIVTTLLWSNTIVANLLGVMAFLPLFTLSVLYFRWIYKTTKWQSLSMLKLTPIIVFYGAFFGFLITTINFIILMPAFSDDLVFNIIKTNPGMTAFNVIVRFIIGQGLQTQLFICLWIFIYCSFSSNRKMQETELRYLKSQNKLKEASLSSLANQLNPHFLFNALNNIRFMMHEDIKSADKIVISLSDILRYSLESCRHEKVLLSQEIEIIERYIAIVKAQLEDELQFSMNISAAHHPYLIPPMALQMLVENSIKHGIDNNYEGGKLTVSSLEIENKLALTVTNDLPTDIEVKKDTTGIGLANIKQRLNILYGDNAKLTITETATEFSVEILLPKELI
ncbi:MAG: histidine kinase [Pseudomonadota bacterium]